MKPFCHTQEDSSYLLRVSYSLRAVLALSGGISDPPNKPAGVHIPQTRKQTQRGYRSCSGPHRQYLSVPHPSALRALLSSAAALTLNLLGKSKKKVLAPGRTDVTGDVPVLVVST